MVTTQKKNTNMWKYYRHKEEDKKVCDVTMSVYSIFIRNNMLGMFWNEYDTQENEIINNIILILFPICKTYTKKNY